MTVIVMGDDPKAIKEITCENCAAVLQYTDWDSVASVHTDYTGSSETSWHIKCPRCEGFVKVR